MTAKELVVFHYSWNQIIDMKPVMCLIPADFFCSDRAIKAEVEQRSSDEETKHAWSVELKNLVQRLKDESKQDLKTMADHTNECTRSPDRKSSKRKRKPRKDKARGSKRDKSTSEDADSDEEHGPLEVSKPPPRRKDCVFKIACTIVWHVVFNVCWINEMEKTNLLRNSIRP